MAKASSERSPRTDSYRRVRQNARIARVLRVLQLIQGRGHWNAQEIAAELECSERTVQRDLNVLEMAGIPWQFDEQTKCYRVRQGWQFPIVNLSPEELLGQAAATAVCNVPGLKIGSGPKPTTQKLAASLPAEAQRILRDAERTIAVLDLKTNSNRERQVVQTIQWALIERKQLTGLYAEPTAVKPTKLTLHPYRLCLVQQAWYMIAREVSARTPTTFRASRFKSLRTISAPADVPQCFNMREHFGNAWAVERGSQTYDVEIEFTAEAAPLVTEIKWHPTQRTRLLRNGAAVLSFRVDGLDEIVRWVLGWASQARVLKPPELREKLVEQLRRGLELN